MASAPGPDHPLAQRSARNRLIDLLGLGDTCLLTNLTAANRPIKLPLAAAHASALTRPRPACATCCAALPQPAYQHQADARDAARNKGLGRRAIGLDFALARGRDAATQPPPGAAAVATVATAPDCQIVPPPRLRLSLAGAAELAADAVLAVCARRAMTGLDTALARSVQPQPLPRVRVKPARLAPGASTQMRVGSSPVGDLHQLQIQRQALADPVPGSGAGLLIDVGPVLADRVAHLGGQVSGVRAGVGADGDGAGGLAARSLPAPATSP